MRWSERETIHFVKLYLSREFLYNTEHPFYKIRLKREQAYKDIIDEFGAFSGLVLDADEVKVKIKNLRATYTQEVTKILQRSTSEKPYIPSIKWFADWHKHFKDLQCSRLKDNIECAEVDVPLEKSELWTSQDSHDDTTYADDHQQADPFIPETDPDDSYIYLVKNEPKVTGIKRERTDSVPKKKKKVKHRVSHKDEAESSIINSTESTEVTKEDEFDIYGKYIASQLRSMNLAKALRLQLEIQSLISEARISDTHQ